MTGGAWRLPSAADERPTFFAHAVALAALHGPGPWPDGGYPLPDENPDEPRPLMSGAVLDGVRTHHGNDEPDTPAATALAAAIRNLVTEPPTTGALRQLHDIAAESDPLRIADALTGELMAGDLPADRMREVGRWLAEHGSRRGAVALGILLLGLAGDERDRELLILLGSMDDLSLYAVVALVRSQPDREDALFELARRVDGWGRIQAVHRLAGTHDPAIKNWLLREGFRNGIMYEYLAHTAATAGDLYGALTTPPVDDELLDSAGTILTALCVGGPAEDMTDYPAAPETIDRYLTLVAERPPHVARVSVVLELADFLASDRAADVNWTDTAHARLRRTCDALVQRSDWRHTVDHALDSADPRRFRMAIEPARKLGIPTRTRIEARLRDHPDAWQLWFELTDVDALVALAQELLPLADLTGPPTLDLGLRSLGPQHILDVIVGQLDVHPGKGWPLIRVALANPGLRNRNMAVRALKTWPADTVGDDVINAVRDAAAIEPDPEIQERMRWLLAAWAEPGGPSGR